MLIITFSFVLIIQVLSMSIIYLELYDVKMAPWPKYFIITFFFKNLVRIQSGDFCLHRSGSLVHTIYTLNLQNRWFEMRILFNMHVYDSV